ncbi:DNA polymerase III [Macleaya cordata]|uniref:DNA polymerase III n=1 Tax=Macleaya cordata TaxID=56857 RepID=A0A200QFM5_MACCD|nr:DNA polymerase III [Macleaya cordata]
METHVPVEAELITNMTATSIDNYKRYETEESRKKPVKKNRHRSSSSLAGSSNNNPNEENSARALFRRSSSLSKDFADATIESALNRALKHEREDEKSISILKPASAQNHRGIPWQFPKIRKGIRTRKHISLTHRKSPTNKVFNQITALKGKNLQEQSLSSEDESEPMTPDLSSAFSSFQHNCQDRRTHGEIQCCSSKSLSKKYQPKLFEDIVGHEIIVKALSSAVQKEKVAPLYLFHGPSGTGKTSVARIFPMALNCESNSQTKPCWSCRCCSRSLYIMDLCSGSRISGFQRIRTLLQSTTFIQTVSGFKVFIIEECHSLTMEAWEEIVDVAETGYSTNVVFVMITENPNTMPRAISSRCQKFCFPKLKDMDITLKLARIVAREKIGIERDALKLVISKAEGSMREAENILDQLVGLVPHNKLLDLLTTAISSDTIKTVRSTRELIVSGVQPQTLVSQLASLITVILSGATEAATSSSPTSSKDNRLLRNGSQLTNNQSQRLSHALKILVETGKQLSSSSDPTTWVVEALLQIASEQIPNRISTDTVLPRDVLIPSDDKYVAENREQSNITTNDQNTSSESIYKTKICTSTTVRGEPKSPDLAQLGNMEEVWQNMLGKVQNGCVKELLCRQVKLASMTISSANAIAHLIFERPEDKLAAQMSEETISEALGNAFGRPVTVNMSLEPMQMKIIKGTGISTTKSQFDCGHSRQQQGSSFLPASESPSSPNAGGVVMSRSKSQKSSYVSENNFRPMKLQQITEMSKSQENSPPRGQESRIARPQQILPFSGFLSQGDGDASAEPGIDRSIRDQSPRGATNITKATKAKHKWMSLSTIQHGDASVEQYSQDLLFENANMDREKRKRRDSRIQKSSKTNKDQQSLQNGTSR